jgi:hypothetical protein
MVVGWRVVETVFWLLALVTQLPVAGPLWLGGRLLNLADPFRCFIGDLVRWRNKG